MQLTGASMRLIRDPSALSMVSTLSQCSNAASVTFDSTTAQLFIGCGVSGSSSANMKTINGIIRTGLSVGSDCETPIGVRFVLSASALELLVTCSSSALISIDLVDDSITSLVPADICTGSVTRGAASQDGKLVVIVCGNHQIILTSMKPTASSMQIVNIGNCYTATDGIISADSSLITFACASTAATSLLRLATASNTFTTINLSITCSYPRSLFQGDSEDVFYLACDQGLIQHDLRANRSGLLITADKCPGGSQIVLLKGVVYFSCYLSSTVVALNLSSSVITTLPITEQNCVNPLFILAVPALSQVFVTCSSHPGSAVIGIDLASNSMYTVASAGTCTGPSSLDYNAQSHSLVAACSSGIILMSLSFQCGEGSFWNAGECTLCPANTYRNASQISQFGRCLDCPPGTIASAIGSTGCFACDIGSYESNRKCVYCAAGSYQNVTGQTSCTECDLGRYSAIPGSIGCSKCEAGSASNTTGSLVCNLCLPGQFQINKGATLCNPCDVGRYSLSSASTFCPECDAGFYASEQGTVSCLACTPGRSSNSTARSSACDICQPGTYQNGIGKTVCFTCEAQSYSEKPESTSCTRCDAQVNSQRTACNSTMCDKNTQYNTVTSNCDVCELGQYSAIGGRCTDCSLNSYTPFAGSDCISCQLPGMRGLTCASGIASVNEGYWSYLSLIQPDGTNGLKSPSFLYQTVECPRGYCPSHSLQVRQASNSNSSSANATISDIVYCAYPRLNDPSNSLCATCAEDYLPWNGECVSCTGPNGPLIFAGVILSFLLVIFLLQSSGSAAGTVSIFLFFIQTCALEIGPISRFMNWIQILNLDAKSTSACLTDWTPQQQTLFSLFMPLILLGELAVIALLHFVLYKRIGGDPSGSLSISASSSSENSPQPYASSLLRIIRGFSIDTYIAASMSILLFCYTQVSTACFSYLYCVPVAEHRLLFAAPTVDCDSSDYKAYLIPVIMAIVGYIVAFPIVIIALLWTHTESLFVPSEEAGRLSSSVSSSLVRYAPLYKMYQPRAWFWQPLVLLRRAAFAVVSVVLAQQPAFRFMIFNVLHFVSLLLHFAIYPFRLRSLNVMETASYSLLILLSAMLTGCLPPYELSVQVLTFLLIVPAALCMFLYVLYDRWASKAKQASLVKAGDVNKNSGHEPYSLPAASASPSAEVHEVELSSYIENPMTTSTPVAREEVLRRPSQVESTVDEEWNNVNSNQQFDVNARIVELRQTDSEQATL